MRFLVLCLGIVTACHCPTSGGPSARAAAPDTVRGLVVVAGANPGVVLLRVTGGAELILLQGPANAPLRSLESLEIFATGTIRHGPQGRTLTGVRDFGVVADSGQPKDGNANAAALGDGGLQKWVYNTQTSTWVLQYDISAGLNLVNNANANSNTPTAPGVTGLFGLTGEDVDVNGVEEVELFATSYGLNELSPSDLYEVTDVLDSNTLAISGGLDDFTTLYSAPDGTSIRGVSFAPTATPLPASWTSLLIGLAGFGFITTRRRKHGSGLVAA